MIAGSEPGTARRGPDCPIAGAAALRQRLALASAGPEAWSDADGAKLSGPVQAARARAHTPPRFRTAAVPQWGRSIWRADRRGDAGPAAAAPADASTRSR